MTTTLLAGTALPRGMKIHLWPTENLSGWGWTLCGIYSVRIPLSRPAEDDPDLCVRCRRSKRAHRQGETTGQSVTLDGHPAVITGYGNRFATVATLEHGHGGPVEFSWAAVEHVLARGGAFHS